MRVTNVIAKIVNKKRGRKLVIMTTFTKDCGEINFTFRDEYGKYPIIESGEKLLLEYCLEV